MGSPFDEVDGELRLIQYRPHQNCHLVARFLGAPDTECESHGDDTDRDWVLGVPGVKDWCRQGDWIATRDGKTFEVVDADDLIDFIKGTARTWLTA
jgi:hypothetical protein